MKPADLVDAAIELDAEIKLKKLKLDEIKAEILKLGPGDYFGDIGKAVVIQPSAALKPNEDAIAKAQEMVTPAEFAKLFIKTIVFKPAKAFREVAAALLKPKKAEQLIELCEVPAEAYVKLTAAPA